MYSFLLYNLSTKAHEGPQQPTKADAGPQRGKRAQMTPDASFGLAAAGICKFFFNVFFFTVQLIYESPRRPTAANKGRRRPTKMENGPNNGEVRVFFTVQFIFYFLYY